MRTAKEGGEREREGGRGRKGRQWRSEGDRTTGGSRLNFCIYYMDDGIISTSHK